MGKREKLNLFWLARKGLFRFKFWFILKLLIISLWIFFIFNVYMGFQLGIPVLKSKLSVWIFSYLFLFINFLSILLIVIITIFTLRLRKNELGLYRCSGASRGEIISLVLNESIILSIIVMICVLILEFIFVFYFRFLIAGFISTNLDFSFICNIVKGFVFSFFFIFIVLFLCYIPFGIYYAFRDPYNIVKY